MSVSYVTGVLANQVSALLALSCFSVGSNKWPHTLKRRITDSRDLDQLVDTLVWPRGDDLRSPRASYSGYGLQLRLRGRVDVDYQRPFGWTAEEAAGQAAKVANQPHSSASDSYHRGGGYQPLLVTV